MPHVLGVTHPTGLPDVRPDRVAFELLPLGSVACGEPAVGGVCRAGAWHPDGHRHALGVRPWLAALAALATGAVATVWSSAIVAEVNPLHLAADGAAHPPIPRVGGRAPPARPRPRRAARRARPGQPPADAFVAPFFIGFALWAGRHTLRERPAWLLAPVSRRPPAWPRIPTSRSPRARHPPLVYNDPVTFDRLRFLVTGEQFRSHTAGCSRDQPVHVPVVARRPRQAGVRRATPVLPIVGLVGLVLLRRRLAFGLACWGALIAGIDVWANYLRLEHYLLVPWLLLGSARRVARCRRRRLLAAGAWRARAGGCGRRHRGARRGARDRARVRTCRS